MTRQDIRQLVRTGALLSQLGITVVVAILLGVGIGVSLKGVLGSAGPLLGIFLGLGGAAIGASKLIGEVLPKSKQPAQIKAPKPEEEV